MTIEPDEEGDSVPSVVGRQLGRYTCLRELGVGGMAVLYLAQRAGARGFTKLFALKRIKPKFAADPSFTRMFMREAQLSATLDHPNIAQVIDFGQDGKEYFLVMEYVHGPDLRRLLRLSKGGRLPLECAIAVTTRVCAALHYAHEKSDSDGNHVGLVHRDVSATNVLLSMDGAVKLTDFGIAKGFGKDVSGTSSGMLVGKPGYMSPEQVRCEDLDRRSDVFCLGILLYEVTTGHRCFFGDNVFSILNATQRAEYAPPSERDPEYPVALEKIVAKALQVDPNERYETARALQLELEEFALDNRIRVSDTVLADYLVSLDIELEDAKNPSQDAPPSGTAIRDSGGTAFMLSGGAERAISSVESVESVEDPPRSHAMRYAALGVGAAAVVSLLAFRPWQSDADTSNATPSGAAGVAPVASSPARDAAAVVVVVEPVPAPLPVEVAPAADESEAAPAKVEAIEKPSASNSRRKRSKRKKRGKTGSGGKPSPSELDALAPPSRRGG